MPYHSINVERFTSLLDESSKIGLKPNIGPGLFRLALSDEDMKGRKWLKQQMDICGLTVYEDAALNIHGFLPLKRGAPYTAPTPQNRYVVTGSHHDTVIGGGRLDGALGVVAGLECLARIGELVKNGDIDLKYPLEVINFTDEEGRFGGMLGSMCIAGTMADVDQFVKMKSADSGQTVGALLKEASSTKKSSSMMTEKEYCQKCIDVMYEKGSIEGYVELHIEQGPVLEQMKEQIGVVTGICGLWKIEVIFDGQANHAGTTPMNMRQNAFEGCARMQISIPTLLNKYGKETTVCTIGTVKLVPNCPNVVPGKATFTIELRDEDQEIINSMSHHILNTLEVIAKELNLAMDYRTMSNMPPVVADKNIQDMIMRHGKIETANNEKPVPRVMPSGAAHDAQQIANVGPMGMIFVPSVNGISHHHSEHTELSDLVAGANVLLNTLIELATKGIAVKKNLEETEMMNNVALKNDAIKLNSVNIIPSQIELEKPKTILLCIDLQNMEPTSERSDVDFNSDDLSTWRKNVPQLLDNVVKLQQLARKNPDTMEIIHCRIMSRTKDGRDRSKLHKRMNIHVPPARNGLQDQGSFMEGVGPVDDEMVFNKTGSNAFVTTNLHYVLSNMDVKNLICCGVLTDECVAGTVKAACDLGYECTVVEDACLAGSKERHDAAITTVRRFASQVVTTSEFLSTSTYAETL
jgi:beta-ureidopropionase / N-carbamoyl-L-amino-acid hydrolase